MNLARPLALVATLLSALTLSGCIVLTPHRHHGWRSETVVVVPHGQRHAPPRRHERDTRWDDSGPYRR